MSLLSPGIYMRRDAAHWPWPVDLFPPGGAPYVSIPGPHHYAPDAICDLLRVKSWRFTADWSGGGYSFSVDQVVNAGTIYTKSYEDEPVIVNSPGWADLNEAVEKNMAQENAFGIAGIRVETGYEITSGPDEGQWFYGALSIQLRVPGVAYSEEDPEWRMHVGAIPYGTLSHTPPSFGFSHAAVMEQLVNPLFLSTLSYSDQLEYLGETIGNAANGWTITVAVASIFEQSLL